MREALRAQASAVTVVRVEAGREDERRREVEELCSAYEIPMEETAGSWFDGHTEAVHNGFAAQLADRATADDRTGAGTDLVVLAEDVQDPRNLGALVRVCEGAGVSRLLLRDRGSTRSDDVVAKTSAGASQYLTPERITNSAREIQRLQQDGFWVYGAAGDGVPPWELDLTGNVAIVIGGEEKGLRRLTRERCDALIGLPMLGRVQSLNLATAAAAILYECLRQRST